jgi:DNA polymerase-3 subunit beta
MKFVVPKSELNHLINKIQTIVPAKPAIPILTNILIEAKGGMLTLYATDLVVGIRCSTRAEIHQEGSVTVPAKRFFQLIRELTAASIEITVTQNAIEVVANSSRFKLHGTSQEEYPLFPNFLEAPSFTLKQDELKEMFYRTAFAVSKEDNRYVLTGVCLRIAHGVATFMGTNGKCLGRSHIALNIDPNFSGTYVFPSKAVEEVLKNLTAGEEEVKISLLTDKIAVETANVAITTKLLTGDYPDVNLVIPEHSEWKVALHRDELISMLRQISLFLADPTHSARFTFADGELKLSANSPDIGEGHVSMPINYSGPVLDVAYNPGFFLDILRHSKKETVSLGLTDAFNPGIILDNDIIEEFTTKASPLFVIMPMRLNDN